MKKRMPRLTKTDGLGNPDLKCCFDCDIEKAGADLEHCGMCPGFQAMMNRLWELENILCGTDEKQRAYRISMDTLKELVEEYLKG